MQVLKNFETEGYVILKGIISRTAIDHVIEDMKELVDKYANDLLISNKISDLLLNEPFEKRLYLLYKDHLDIAPKSFRKELHKSGMFDLFFNSSVLDIVQSLLGEELRLYPNYTARPKFPEWEGTQVLWHQDAGYTANQKSDNSTNVEQLKMVNVWTPLVPATVYNGCMQFIPGSHKFGIVPHVSKEHYLEIEKEYLQPHLKNAKNIIVDPGDIVLFNNMLFHQGQPNLSQEIRWSVDWRYQDANQSTSRVDQGHLARSQQNPDLVVKSSEEWVKLSWK